MLNKSKRLIRKTGIAKQTKKEKGHISTDRGEFKRHKTYTPSDCMALFVNLNNMNNFPTKYESPK